MFFDWTYVVLVLPAVLLAMWASANVNSTFRRYSTQYSRRGITGAQAAAGSWMPTASPPSGSSTSPAT